MIIKKCRDCFREHQIDDDIKLYICGCGGLVFDRDEDSSKNMGNSIRNKATIKDNKKSIEYHSRKTNRRALQC